MQERIRYGIKLLLRKCSVCLNVFWVPEKSPQKHCCVECQMEDGIVYKQYVLNRIRGLG